MQLSEKKLCHKLLVTGHLSVPERRALPTGRARFSVMVEVVREALAEHHWFPRRLVPDAAVFGEVATIEMREDVCWFHTQSEVGYLRYSGVSAVEVGDVEMATRELINSLGGDNIDGIAISWTE